MPICNAYGCRSCRVGSENSIMNLNPFQSLSRYCFENALYFKLHVYEWWMWVNIFIPKDLISVFFFKHNFLSRLKISICFFFLSNILSFKTVFHLKNDSIRVMYFYSTRQRFSISRFVHKSLPRCRYMFYGFLFYFIRYTSID